MALSPKPESGRTSAGAGPSHDSRSFEAAYTELQQLVEQLDSGGQAGLDLEQALDLYERGTQLARRCEQIIQTAELRVTRLTAETATPLADAPDGG